MPHRHLITGMQIAFADVSFELRDEGSPPYRVTDLASRMQEGASSIGLVVVQLLDVRVLAARAVRPVHRS